MFAFSMRLCCKISRTELVVVLLASFSSMIPRRSVCQPAAVTEFRNFDDVEIEDVIRPVNIFARVDVNFPVSASGNVQRFILLDMTGSKIEAVARGTVVSTFNDILKEGCTYTMYQVKFKKISNEVGFCNIENTYECILGSHTLALLFVLPIQFPPYPKHLMLPFHKVIKSPDKTFVDIAAIVVHFGELEYIGTSPNRRQYREIILMDASSNMIAVGIWAEHLRRYAISLPSAAADKQIIIGTMLRQNYKHGCFETSGYTKFAFNPTHHATSELRAFRQKLINGTFDFSTLVKEFLEMRWAYLATVVRQK